MTGSEARRCSLTGCRQALRWIRSYAEASLTLSAVAVRYALCVTHSANNRQMLTFTQRALEMAQFASVAIATKPVSSRRQMSEGFDKDLRGTKDQTLHVNDSC